MCRYISCILHFKKNVKCLKYMKLIITTKWGLLSEILFVIDYRHDDDDDDDDSNVYLINHSVEFDYFIIW